MKKQGIIIIAIATAIVCLIATALIVFRIFSSSPQYELKQTADDIGEYGMEGLLDHLSEDSRDKVETIADFAAAVAPSDGVSSFVLGQLYDYLQERLSDVEWTLSDIDKGKDTAYALIGFNYQNCITGSVEVVMIKEKHHWKIDGVDAIEFTKVDLDGLFY